MTVKELHDALSMAYWKGISDTKVDIPMDKVDEFNKNCEAYLDKLLVQVLSGIKVSVK